MRRAENRGATVRIASLTIGEPAVRDAERRRDRRTPARPPPRAAGRARRRRRHRPRRSCRRCAAIDHPAVVAGEALGPPAVADAQVRHAVHRRLHAARAARLERLARIVQPHVAALHQEVRDVQVVVVDERDASAELRIERALVDALQVVLADVVGRMRLAGEDDLHRAGRRVQDAREPIRVVEDQLGPLVAGEAAREADRQRVRIEQRAGGDDARRSPTRSSIQRWRARSRMKVNR